MKNIRVISIVLVTIIILISSSASISKKLYEIGLFPDEYRFGDLYRLAYLKEFKEQTKTNQSENQSVEIENDVALYIIGDSFTEPERVNNQHFKAAQYQYVNINETAELKNSIKRKILIIETVERHAREHFSRNVINFSKNLLQEKQEPKINVFFNTERFSNLFLSNDFSFWFKEKKAALNKNIFDRIDPKTTISNDGKHLLYYLDTDSNLPNSCFSELPESEIDSMVTNLNRKLNTYQSMGFDEVFLSIIPNKTTICCQNDGNYNHLIERIQQHKNLKIKVIDNLNMIGKKSEFYSKSDTHFSEIGKQKWINFIKNQIYEKQ